ncbi:hypothetical protein GCM10009608_79710 [Pseudonocardia alaniniphila]
MNQRGGDGTDGTSGVYTSSAITGGAVAGGAVFTQAASSTHNAAPAAEVMRLRIECDITSPHSNWW